VASERGDELVSGHGRGRVLVHRVLTQRLNAQNQRRQSKVRTVPKASAGAVGITDLGPTWLRPPLLCLTIASVDEHATAG